MEIFLQSKSSWLDTASRNIYQKVNLLSKYDRATCVPVQFLIASSTLLQSILTPSCPCELSTSSSISLPSVTNSTLQLLSQILCKGETEKSEGLETTMTNLREMQDVIAMLGLNVKICPKLSYDKRSNESVYSGSVVVKDEVLVSEDSDTLVEEVDDQYSDQPTVKKASTVAKKSSTSGKFKKSGLLKDFKVNLVKSLVDGGDNTEEGGQKLEKSGNDNQRNKCNICGSEFAKFPSLRRHYRENHGIQDNVSPQSEVFKSSENDCPKCYLKFKFRGSLLRHFRRKHKNTEDIRKHINVQNSEYEVNSAYHQHRNIHVKIHESNYGEQLGYQCQDCDKKYSSSWSLPRHRQNKHLDFIDENQPQQDMSVHCKECGLVLTSRKGLIQHLREVHKKSNEVSEGVITPNRFKCSDCDETFKNRSIMRRHVNKFHEGKTYGCGVCDRVCGSRFGALSHCIAKDHNKNLIYSIVDFP